jgi:AAA15 family ATPase/GTPase
MKLSFLRLKNYRNISDCTIDLSKPITTLIGRNNSGKTSVLDAIFSCLSTIEIPYVMNRNLRTGEAIIEVGFFLSPEEWQKFFRETGYPQFYLGLDKCKNFQTIELKKRYVRIIKNGSIHTKKELILPSLLGSSVEYSKYSEHFSELQKIGGKNLAVMFGVVKISPAGHQLSTTGNFIPYNKIKPEDIIKNFNVWLLHIKRKFPKEYKQFCNELKSLFPEIDSFDILFDQDTGSVRLQITEKGDVSSITRMGSGFHSTLMLCSFLLSRDFKIVIVDEPCVHMHSKLIALIAKYLENTSRNKQLIIATHNSELINWLPRSSIVYLNEDEDGKFTPNTIDKPSEFLGILEELGIKASDLVFDLNAFETTKAAQILVENVNPKIGNQYIPVLDYLGDNALSYYPESDISIRDFSKDSKAYNLMVKLKDCPLGSEGWVRYQEICSDILSYVFSPPLSTPLRQSETEGREQRRDLIMHIPYNIGYFWGWIQTEHKSLAVIIECKNYEGLISKDDVIKTSQYFNKNKLGNFGLLLSRKGLDKGAKKEIRRLWTNENSKIMVIPLKDDDLINLLKIKEHGEKPEVYIDAYYRKFRMSIY